MKQYCRYCSHCFQADENEFRCSDHPKGKQPHWTRKQINRANYCPNFDLSELGDAETGAQYRPRKDYDDEYAEQLEFDYMAHVNPY